MAESRRGQHDEQTRKPLVWLHGEVKTPPFTAEGRQEAGMLLRLLTGRREAVLVLEVYPKKTRKIPDEVMNRCKLRLKQYDAAVNGGKKKGPGN